jgi:hypothetical protein
LLRRRKIGRSALVRANAQNRVVRPLTELLMLTWGPLHVVADEFAGLADTDQVLIFGSWAARYRQASGPPAHDIDVLVVGRRGRAAVYDAADKAQRPGLPTAPTSWATMRLGLIGELSFFA